MSIKPQYETYRYTSELCKTRSQSIVECRLPGSEINAVLKAHAAVTATECVCLDGEIKITGKLVLAVVYEDANKMICRAERGAEFFLKSEDALVTPACLAKTNLTARSVTTRREGSGLYLSVIVEAESTVFGSKTAELFTGGENLVVKTEEKGIVKRLCVSGETDLEDEFETEYFGDLLLHTERACVNSTKALGGEIEVSGEVILHLCALKEDGSLSTYERLIPFVSNVPCDEPNVELVSATAKVLSANLQITADEEKGKSKIVVETTLGCDCAIYGVDSVSCVVDAFSTTNEIRLNREKRQGRYLLKEIYATERVNGIAALSLPIAAEDVLLAAVCPRAEIACRKRYDEAGYENGVDAEGVVEAELLIKTADGLHKAVTLSLPFAFPARVEDSDESEIDCAVCGLSVKRRAGGELELSATLKTTTKLYRLQAAEYVSSVEEGESVAENECAVSIFIPREGDGLWELATRLKSPPEEVKKNNPHLSFPVKKGERIVIYRRKA